MKIFEVMGRRGEKNINYSQQVVSIDTIHVLYLQLKSLMSPFMSGGYGDHNMFVRLLTLFRQLSVSRAKKYE